MVGERPRRIFLVGFYGVHNLGDEAIRTAIVASAEARGAEVVAVASRDPHDPDPRAVPMRGLGLWRYLRAILQADRVVLGGGGILKDEGPRIPLELLATALAARLLGRDVALLAVGVGPFYTRLGRWLAKATARLATTRTVRDVASVEALSALGVARVRLGADPTFRRGSWPAGPVADPGPVPDADPARRRRVVVSLRPWFLRAPDGDARRAVLRAAVAEAIAPLVAEGWEVEFVSLYWPRDLDESRAVAAEVRPATATVIDAELDWDGLTDRVVGADLVIAMRYHAVAAAAQAGRPVIALAYEPKVRSLAADLHLPSVDVDDPELARRLASCIESERQSPGTSTADAGALEALRDRAEVALDLALGTRSTPPA